MTHWMGFDPRTFVIMADKTLKRVENLEYGDKVSCGNNQFATVHKVQSVNFDQPFQMCDFFGVILTARSVVRNEYQEWKYFYELTTDQTTCPIIMQIELDTIHEIECKGDVEIICMTKNHKCDLLIYDAVLTENIENSDVCSFCANNCIIEGKVFQSHCATIDYCPLCVPIIHFAVSSV
jgi:hypothetical protein